MMCIYKFESLSTGEIYIGSTVNFSKRVGEHIKKLNLGCHANKNLQKHFNKYGVTDFVFTVLKEFSDEVQMRKEEMEIIQEKRNTFNVIGSVNHLQEARIRLIRALGVQDYSYQEIADIFGVTKSYVYKIISSTSKDYVCPWVKRSDI